MKGFGLSLNCLLVITFTASLLISVSAGSTKEHKKKLMEKLRAALNPSDTDAAVDVAANVEQLDKDSTPDKNVILQVEDINSSSAPVAVVNDKDVATSSTEVAAQPANNYVLQLRAIMKRIMTLLGYRTEKIDNKEGRENRMLDDQTNEDSRRLPMYENEVRTTVGAVMGDNGCLQKVACGAGTYLKNVKGKKLIFSLLESISPPNWKDTVKVVKRSALFDEMCNFRCLED